MLFRFVDILIFLFFNNVCFVFCVEFKILFKSDSLLIILLDIFIVNLFKYDCECVWDWFWFCIWDWIIVECCGIDGWEWFSDDFLEVVMCEGVGVGVDMFFMEILLVVIIFSCCWWFFCCCWFWFEELKRVFLFFCMWEVEVVMVGDGVRGELIGFCKVGKVNWEGIVWDVIVCVKVKGDGFDWLKL